MDSTSSKSAGATLTPAQQKIAGHARRSTSSQNRNPNVSTTRLKTGNGAVSRRANPNQLAPPPSSSLKKKKNNREGKLRKAGVGGSSRAAVVCENCKTVVGGTPAKCFCVKASHDDFVKNTEDFSSLAGIDNGGENEENGESGLRKSRARLLEAARRSLPESGSGRVMHLVMAFENMLTISKLGDEREYCKNVMKWALPGLQETCPEFSETSSVNPSDFALTPEKFGSGCSYSLECSQGSISARTSTGGRKSRPSIQRSNESSGTVTKRNGKRQQNKQTSQKPFILRTEQRERSKGENFTKKLQQTLEEEGETAESSRRRRNHKADEGARPKGGQ